MNPVSSLLLPPAPLSGCLFAALYRDTRGATLGGADRVNHFPASPLVSLTRVLHGTLHMLPAGQDWRAAAQTPPLPQVFVMKPMDHPVSSWSAGPVTAISIGIYHDAWLYLGGDGDFTRAPNALISALDRFAAAPDTDTGWQALCNALVPVWDRSRPGSWQAARGLTDWARNVIARAALSGSGRSLRSLERRIKRQSGQTRRALDFYSAFETLHRISRNDVDSPLADIALQAGYCDQSHMGRAVRRATGFSPARLNHAIETQEPFWCYRLLGERF